MTPEQNSSNQQNANKGTSGTNPQYDKAQGNTGKQLNPTTKAAKARGKVEGEKEVAKGN